MTKEELKILCTAEVRQAIEDNIERRHYDVALDKSLCHSALVATQVKYLQKSRTKLPSYYASRCIIPPLAFEQSSSEATAEVKHIEGESVLELTCGLGVDALSLSRRFRRVVTLERDETVAAVARENFRRLGAENIEVVTTSAEEYLTNCSEHFDWIYADPDRRGTKGEKRVLLEDCSPNMLALRGDLERLANGVVIKLSPLFDVDEAFRLYPASRVEVVSLGGECKEVVIYSHRDNREEMIGATAIGLGSVWLPREGDVTAPRPFEMGLYDHLIIPDVSLQKGRIARRLLSEVCDIWSDNGYGLIEGEKVAGLKKNRHLARVYKIAWIGEYEPRTARKELSARGITTAEILKRESPLTLERITKQLKIKEGAGAQGRRIAITTICNRQIMMILE